ncbi:hypothetical protein QJS10_CPB12g01781 [Acorus calamus]|uniref:NUC153 domain-containing protein n=1 Tax=Acorus calamus TaxID=4465 RepID=A0AAV9DKL1_ACOCL|nr:hypothetical protein QJS10_CPB12g01781 [Acorus calamus]
MTSAAKKDKKRKKTHPPSPEAEAEEIIATSSAKEHKKKQKPKRENPNQETHGDGSAAKSDKKKKNKRTKEESPSPSAAEAAEDEPKPLRRRITDPRFASAQSDPRFQRAPSLKSKVSIDSRFNKMFSDKRFSSASSAPVDKHGRTNRGRRSENPLRHYYRQNEEEGEEEEKRSKGLDSSESDPWMDSEGDDSDTSSSRSDDDDDVSDGGTDSEISVDAEEEMKRFFLLQEEENVPTVEQETHRLSAVHMDWDNIKAVDLYVLLSSFLPKGGQILQVSIYPSEFGIKRMEEEAVRGPVGVFDGEENDGVEDDDDSEDEVDQKKVCQYELDKLRYYFAVIECDSPATADHLYNSCNGHEVELSGNFLDLRFIPDSMEFKHPPRDVAKQAPSNYEALNFQTDVLQQSKVNLTWDDDEPERKKILRRKFNPEQLSELEFKDFLASDDDSEDDNENDDQSHKLSKAAKYQALIQSGDGSDAEDNGDKDMEITFNPGLEDISKHILEKKDKGSETVWEAYLRKKREKKKARKNASKYSSDDDSSGEDEEVPDQPDDFFDEESSGSDEERSLNAKKKKKSEKRRQPPEMDGEREASRAELELLLADGQGNGTNLKGYNLKGKKHKGKKGKEVPDEEKLPSVDYDDTRFSALFNSHLFALDPTDPQFKRSAAYYRQLAKKQSKGAEEEKSEEEQKVVKSRTQAENSLTRGATLEEDRILQPCEMSSKKKEKHELSFLVRSVKNKIGCLKK